MELPGHCSSHEATEKQRRFTEPRPHGAIDFDQQISRRAEAQRRRGLAEAEMCGAARTAKMCMTARRVLADEQRCAGHAVPRGQEDARGCEVAVAASPRSAPTLREFSRALLCSLLSFPRSIKPALTRFRAQFPPSFVSRSVSRPPARFPVPAQGWRPPHPPWRPEDALGRPGGRLASKADAICILARRCGRLAPRGRLDA